MREQSNRRKPSKLGNRRKGRKGPNRNPGGNPNGNRARGGNHANGNVANGNVAGVSTANGNTLQGAAAPGVCVKCGHPASDGKLCNFHRSLLNSIRNDFGKRAGKTNTFAATPFNY